MTMQTTQTTQTTQVQHPRTGAAGRRDAGEAVPPPATSRIRRLAATGFTQAVLGLWALMALIPLLWAVVSAFKDNHELFSAPWRLPSVWHFGNFARAWSQAQIGRYFLNTVLVVGCSLVLTMALGAMAAYVLARFEFPGNRIIYFAFVAGMAFPVFLALVPLFFVVKNLGLLGTLPGLIVVYTAYALPFTIFFLTSFFRTMPTSIAEAAVMDGCSHEGVFFRVMLPMAKPGLVSVGIFNFLGMWNQYLLPLVLNPNQHNYVLSQGLAALAAQQGYQSDWSALFAGLVTAALPVIGMYLVLQKKAQAGLTTGLLK